MTSSRAPEVEVWRQRWWPWLLAAAACLACGAPPTGLPVGEWSAPVVEAWRPTNLFVEGAIGGLGPVLLRVDPSRPRSALTGDLARRLGLPPEGDPSRGVGVRAPLRVGTLFIEGQVFEVREVAAFDELFDRPAVGLLGADVVGEGPGRQVAWDGEAGLLRWRVEAGEVDAELTVDPAAVPGRAPIVEAAGARVGGIARRSEAVAGGPHLQRHPDRTERAVLPARVTRVTRGRAWLRFDRPEPPMTDRYWARLDVGAPGQPWEILVNVRPRGARPLSASVDDPAIAPDRLRAPGEAATLLDLVPLERPCAGQVCVWRRPDAEPPAGFPGSGRRGEPGDGGLHDLLDEFRHKTAPSLVQG